MKESGKLGYVKVGATIVHVTDWEHDTTSELQKVTDTGSGGCEERLPQNDDAIGSFKAYWHPDTPPYGSTPGLKSGVPFDLYEYVGNPTNGRFWHFFAIAKSVKFRSGAKGLEFDTSWELQKGPITYPTV